MKKLIVTLAGLALCQGLLAQQGTDELSTRYNQYGVEINRNKLSAEERGGILVFEDAKQTYKLWFDIRVQADGAFFFGQNSDYDPIGNGLSVRRARFAVKAQITPNWYGEIDTDFSNGIFELKDALVRYDGLRDFQFSLGNMKEDFSMSEVTTSRYLSFMERPAVVSAMAPGRHIGFDANYQRDWLYASGGIFFQTIDNLETRTFVEDNNKDYGRTSGPSYTGRLVITPFYKMHAENVGLHLGVSGSYRLPKTDVAPAEYGTTRYSARNATSINRRKYLDTNLIPNTDHESLTGIELAGWYKGLRFQGEYIGSKVVARDDTKHKFGGWYAEAGYVLFGGKHRYDKSGAKFTQPTRGKKWGDMELLARYDYLDLNDGNITGGAGENYTLGLNYYVNQSVKFVLNYQYTNNDRYANGKGKLYVGHDASGKPTRDPKAVIEKGGKAGVDYNMIGMRIEIDF